MKGKLIKIENKWVIQYMGHPVNVLQGEENLVNYIPLEGDLLSDIIKMLEIPDDEIDKDADVFSKNYSIYDSAQDDVEFGFREGAKWYKQELKWRQ